MLAVVSTIILQIATAICLHFIHEHGSIIEGLEALGLRFVRVIVETKSIWILGAGFVVLFFIGTTANLSYSGAELEAARRAGMELPSAPDLMTRVPALVAAGIELLSLGIILIGRLFAGGDDMTFGSARWASSDHTAVRGLIGETGIRLGTFRDPDLTARRKAEREGVVRPLHYTGARHGLVLGPTRSGKGTGFVVPNLLSYAGSVVAIDPKGENARLTHARRAKLGASYVLDPWGVSGCESARFNPVDILKPDSPTLIEDALLIAEALIVSEGGGDGAFWDQEARALIFGFLLHLATSPAEDGRRHLGRLRDMLTATTEEMTEIMVAMALSTHPVVVASGARFVSKSENLQSNVLASAQAQTHFLESDTLRAHLEASDLAFADLKGDKPVTVYIVPGVDRLSTFSRWLRMLIALGIADVGRNPATPERPVVFLMDEFTQLGRLAIVEDAYALMAGMGIQLHAIVQDLSKLKGVYKDSWQTLVANAGLIQVLGCRDVFTAEYISKMIGVTTRMMRSTSSGSSGGGSSHSVSFAPTQRPLIFPDELMRMDDEGQVILIENADPVLANKAPWFKDETMKALVSV